MFNLLFLKQSQPGKGDEKRAAQISDKQTLTRVEKVCVNVAAEFRNKSFEHVTAWGRMAGCEQPVKIQRVYFEALMLSVASALSG